MPAVNPTHDAPDDSRAGQTPPASAGRRPGAATGPIQYKGSDLEPERGPGLGCFRIQLVALAIIVVLTPVSVALAWPYELSAALLFLTILLLLFTGQTIIFLLRLVAAERRGRRRPLAAQTPTVGELEDAGQLAESPADDVAGDPGPAAGSGMEQATGGSAADQAGTADGPAGAPPGA